MQFTVESSGKNEYLQKLPGMELHFDEIGEKAGETAINQLFCGRCNIEMVQQVKGTFSCKRCKATVEFE